MGNAFVIIQDAPRWRADLGEYFHSLSDLDLYVFDESGNLICKDESGADDMLCRWRPRWNGHFIVKIRNLGVANEYVLVHN